MAKYLLIESRDPFGSADVANYFDLASGLAKEGNEVTLFLVENGVLPARRCSKSHLIHEAVKGGVTVLADEFSLRERGIGSDRLTDGVEASPLTVVIDELSVGARTMWH